MASRYDRLSRDKPDRLLRMKPGKPAQARANSRIGDEQERYRTLFEQAADGIFVLDAHGFYQDANESGLRLLGMERKELLGQHLRNVVLEQDIPAMEADWAALQQGIAFLGERRLKRKDGSIIAVEVSARKLSDGRVQGILRDISYRKQAEEALIRREERFRNLTAAAFEGIGINEHGKIVDVNDQLAHMFGYTREELLGQEVSLVIAPESKGLVEDAIRSGREGPYEHLARRKDGTVFEVEVRAKTVIWGGRTVRVSALRDITERKRAAAVMERQLAFNEVLNRVLSRFATCAAADANATVVEALRAIAEFIGADHAYVVLFSADRSSWGATHEWCAPNVVPRFHHYQDVPLGTKPWSEAKILAGETLRLDTLDQYPPAAALELKLDRAEGALSVLSVPIRGQAGQLTGCVGLHAHAHPITWSDADIARLRMVGDAIANLLERKRVEESLRELSHRLHRAQDEERRRIARELHDSTAQLLAAASMNLGVLEAPLIERDTKHLKLVRECIGLVERCSQEVRMLAYLLHPPLLDQMGLEPALRSYVEGFAKRSGLALTLDLGSDQERLPEEIELALFRMVQEGLGNIHRHSGSRAARISLVRDKDRVILEVADQGIGIPARTLQAIQNGSAIQGVGLAAMRERLREISAQFVVESSSEGTRLRAIVPLEKFQS